VKTVKGGERIPIKEPDIVDWLYMKDGKMIGNYASRPAHEIDEQGRAGIPEVDPRSAAAVNGRS